MGLAGSRSACRTAAVRLDRASGIRRRADRARLAVACLRTRVVVRTGAWLRVVATDAVDVTAGFRAPESPTQRLSALLHDGQSRRDPDPGTAPPQGADPPGHQHL